MKTKTISKHLNLGYERRVIFFWILVGVSFLSLGAYIYAVNSMARSIAFRQSLEREMINVSANLHSLEFSYIELKNSVTMELAEQYGFQEVRNPLYVSRTPTASLSFNTIDNQ